MNLIIDYLVEDDRTGNMFAQAARLFENHEHVTVNSKAEFLEELFERDLTDVDFITILTHGVTNQDYLCKDDQLVNAVSYDELIEILNTTVNGENVILNITGPCETFSFNENQKLSTNTFKEIWVSTIKTTSLVMPFEMVSNGFDYVIGSIEDREIENKNFIMPYEKVIL